MATNYWEDIPSALTKEERDELHRQDRETLTSFLGSQFTSTGFNEITEEESEFTVTFVEDGGGWFGFRDDDGEFAPLIDTPRNREELSGSARDAFLDL